MEQKIICYIRKLQSLSGKRWCSAIQEKTTSLHREGDFSSLFPVSGGGCC